MQNNHWLILIFWLCFANFIEANSQKEGLEADPHSVERDDAKSRIKALFQLSDKSRSENPRLAISYNQQAFELANSSGQDTSAVNSLLNIIEIYYTMSDMKNAMEYAYKAKDQAEKKGLKLETAIVLDHMGMIYYDIGDREKCSHLFFESLRYYEKLGEKEGMCKTLSWIGQLYLDQPDYTKAWDYYSKSLEIARQINSQEGIAANLNNLSKILTSRQLYQESLKYLEESLAISQKIENPSFIASNYLNIGVAYYSLGEYPKALEYFDKSLEIFNKIANKVRIAAARIKIGETYLEMNRMDSSKNNILLAMDLGLQNGYRDIIYRSAKLMHKMSLLKHDTIQAYRYSIIEHQWLDSLDINAKEKSLASLELKYRFEKKEQEDNIRRERRTWLVIAGFILMAFIIIIILLILNHFRMRAKKSLLEKMNLEQELDFKKKELIFNVMSLMKQNERFAAISGKILQFENKVQNPETLNVLKWLGNELKKSSEKESLKEFSLRFKEIHQEFYD